MGAAAGMADAGDQPPGMDGTPRRGVPPYNQAVPDRRDDPVPEGDVVLEVLPAPEHVVSMRVSGRVETEDVERGIAAVEEALARQDRIALYAEVAMSGMTPGAFIRDLGYGLRHLRELHRFARMAVVTEQEWVRRIVRAESHILPQIEIRTFTPDERDDALAWTAQPITSGSSSSRW
jgi:hypothetical protein